LAFRGDEDWRQMVVLLPWLFLGRIAAVPSAVPDRELRRRPALCSAPLTRAAAGLTSCSNGVTCALGG